MSANLTDLGRRFRFNEGLLGLVTQHLEEGDWGRQPDGGGNTPHWILGHVAATRRYLFRSLGGELAEAPWEEHFSMKTKPAGTDGYPAPADLIADFAASGVRVADRLGAMTEDEAAAEWGGAMPDGGKTRAELAGFLYMHECYHLGQIGLLNRMCGHPGFA